VAISRRGVVRLSSVSFSRTDPSTGAVTATTATSAPGRFGWRSQDDPAGENDTLCITRPGMSWAHSLSA
jgi:hypothetical protein